MDINVGSHCALPSCHILDFLPIRCQCDQYFCKDHISPQLHSCPTLKQPADLSAASSVEALRRCYLDTCNKPSLDAYDAPNSSAGTCSGCYKSFCAVHRYPESHCCVSQDAPSLSKRKSEAARALLAKNFTSSASSQVPKQISTRRSKVPTDPAKLAQFQKVELMKMRHRAVPGDPKYTSNTPPEQRLHFKLKLDSGIEKVYWFNKAVVTGKVLDLLAIQSKLVSTDSKPLKLIKVLSDGSETLCKNDLLLVDQVEDGCTLTIK